MTDFDGKAAIVTGGALGIGQAVAKKLAEEGASVVICSDREDQVEEAAEELRGEKLEVQGLRADVTSSEDMRLLIAFTVKNYGGVDILVNSAGVQRYGTVVETEEEVWDEVLAINLKGIYLASKHAIPEMRERGGGTIVNLSSVQAFASQKGVAAYTASKGGINALTRAMALDHAEENIRVNAVCPGWIDTPFNQPAIDFMGGPEEQERIVKQIVPMGRQGRPEEIAPIVVYLASDGSSYMTGQALVVDGGVF